MTLKTKSSAIRNHANHNYAHPARLRQNGRCSICLAAPFQRDVAAQTAESQTSLRQTNSTRHCSRRGSRSETTIRF